MTAAQFKKLVNKHFKPEIQELGWTGSGYNYRKFEGNHLIKTFGMYGSWMGGKVYCETGIHYDFLPIYYGKNTSIEKITVTECVIRSRLSVGSWSLYKDENENIEQISAILNEFLTIGKSFYEDFENYPNTFCDISPDSIFEKGFRLIGKYNIIQTFDFLKMLIDINLHLGRTEKAHEFSERGIAEIKNMAEKQSYGQKKDTNRKLDQNSLMRIEMLKIK